MSRQHDDYLTLEPTYDGISDFYDPHGSHEDISAYNRNLLLLLSRRGQDLVDEGMDAIYRDSFEFRLNGYDVAEAKHSMAVEHEERAPIHWSEGKEEARQLRQLLLLYSEKAFYNAPELLAKLKLIRLGKSNEDLLDDLLELYELITANRDMFSRFKKFNDAWLTRAADLNQELKDTLALMRNPEEVIGQTALREMQAVTYLFEAVHEIRFWGELAFRDEPELLDQLKFSWLQYKQN